MIIMELQLWLIENYVTNNDTFEITKKETKENEVILVMFEINPVLRTDESKSVYPKQFKKLTQRKIE